MLNNYTIFKLLKINGVGNVAINKIFSEIGHDADLASLEEILSKKNKLTEWSNLDELECSNEYQSIINSNIKLVTVLSKEYPKQLKSRYVIDYRHIIHALVKKPRAFRFCKYRDEQS